MSLEPRRQGCVVNGLCRASGISFEPIISEELIGLVSMSQENLTTLSTARTLNCACMCLCQAIEANRDLM